VGKEKRRKTGEEASCDRRRKVRGGETSMTVGRGWNRKRVSGRARQEGESTGGESGGGGDKELYSSIGPSEGWMETSISSMKKGSIRKVLGFIKEGK